MDQQYDPRKVCLSIHHKVTGDLLHLMDGFYSNIEDGLFELAYRYEESEVLQRRYFDLMREMRFRRSNLIQAFAKRMQQGQEYWFGDKFEFDTEYEVDFDAMARAMSEKSTAHFNVILQHITDRTAVATDRASEHVTLPISPYQISYNFLASCRSLDFDKTQSRSSRHCSNASSSTAWARFTVNATSVWKMPATVLALQRMNSPAVPDGRCTVSLIFSVRPITG